MAASDAQGPTARETPILRPGENCWRVEHAERVAFLVDGQQYFGALRTALAAARRQVLVLAWDIDSRFRLVHHDPGDGLPVRLGAFLDALVARRRGLRAHVLSWDFAVVFAMHREWLPSWKLDWRTHRRLRFRLDDHHPVGASHHQKVVVVDDAVAFCGGLDLTQGRWDSNDHAPGDPRRRDSDGAPLRPYHDVQAAVDGAAARALGDLARRRWRQAGQRAPEPPGRRTGTPWPPGLEPDLRDVPVAIARTEGAYRDRPAVREVERLHRDAIAAARASIYIENQYFTSEAIAEALAARLGEEDGPEVVLVLPLLTEGRFSRESLDLIRVERLGRLRRADRFARLAVYYPHVAGLGPEDAINVHAKLMVVDERFARVGSSNLNNRSMALDSECDIAVESAGRAPLEAGIGRFRARLLAEHLGTNPEAVLDATRREGSLIAAIEALRGGAHSLWPLEPRLAGQGVEVPPEHRLVVDPNAPLDPEALIERVVPEEERPDSGRRVLAFAAWPLALLALAAAWRWTPLGDGLDLQGLAALAPQARAQLPGAALPAVAAYLAGGLVGVPVTALVALTAWLFGPLSGLLIAFTGANLSALLTYALGARLGERSVRGLAGHRAGRVHRALARPGILPVAVLRIAPVAPFTVVNLVAGASGVRLPRYLAGTLIGMAPGMVAVVALTERLVAALASPDPVSVGSLALVALGVLAAGVLLSRRLVRPSLARARPGGED